MRYFLINFQHISRVFKIGLRVFFFLCKFEKVFYHFKEGYGYVKIFNNMVLKTWKFFSVGANVFGNVDITVEIKKKSIKILPGKDTKLQRFTLSQSTWRGKNFQIRKR